MTRHRRFAVALAAGVALTGGAVGCNDEPGDAATGPTPLSAATLQLPLRVHLLTSRLAPVHSTLDYRTARNLIARVNEIWAQADIVWQIEAIVREFAQSEDGVEEVLRVGAPFSIGVVSAILPRDRLFTEGWDAFVLHDLASTGAAPGVYLAFIPAAVSSEVDPTGVNDPGRILAHELGHSLNLLHVDCTAGGNLMAPGCPSGDRLRLTPEQIAQARRHAETRRPAKF